MEPASGHAHFSLAMALLYIGERGAEAIEQLDLAMKYEPAWAEPVNELAWLKATSPDPAIRDGPGALRLADRAAELSGHRDASLLDTRAAALAASGRFADAVMIARDACELASRSPGDTTVKAMRDRLSLYERHVPYTKPSLR